MLPFSPAPPSDAAPSITLRGLGRRLVDKGLLTETLAAQAVEGAKAAGTSLMHYVIEQELASPEETACAAAWEYGMPLIDLETLRISALPAADRMPEQLLRRHCMLPVACNEYRLTVAVAYPSVLSHLDELGVATGLTVEGVLAPANQLQSMLDRYLQQHEQAQLSDQLGSGDSSLEDIDFEGSGNQEAEEDQAVTAAESDAPIVRFVNKVLLDAIQRGASDIHFEPYETSYRIRLRIDGILLETARPPFGQRNRIAARLKVISRLDISERRLPQDGAIKLRVSKTRSIDFRVSTLPTVYGEKIVLRILDPASAQMGIDALGFTQSQRALYEQALSEPQGMVLVTGPTGSGKTVTLYTGLNMLNTDERNISTAEDPVEIKVPGINQVNVLPRIGLTFASALRAFLRQDPDVVMVGEIRDLETAEIAVKASQTGHLVLSTLHTNSAAETLTRMINMGVQAFNIASSVSLIIAQRLARRLCPHCKTPTEIPHQALIEAGFSEEEIGDATIYRPVGCRRCTLGYKGRVGIYEVVPISDAMSQLIMQQGNSLELAQQARDEGHPDLRSSALAKAMEGLTSLEEVHRVTTD